MGNVQCLGVTPRTFDFKRRVTAADATTYVANLGIRTCHISDSLGQIEQSHALSKALQHVCLSCKQNYFME